MEQISASLAKAVRQHAGKRGYLLDGVVLARADELIGMALREAGVAEQPADLPDEAAALQFGMEKFAEATMAAAAGDGQKMVGVAHVESAFATVRRWGIFPFSGRRRG